ncbi:hypothetical protein KAR91_03005 [Candidatus Pacearchaeota archaeon]|nr:hypothetical protein [Candidatus Pacearchaeota archaeon]
MPVGIGKRGDQWCTLEPDGTPISCFDTRQEARQQQIAIEVNKAMILPGEDGLRHMFLITSNSYRDREGEIIKARGLKEYAEGKTQTKPDENVLLFWHAGDPIGNIVYAEFYKSFLIEIAKERPDAPINLGEIGGDEIKTNIKTVWNNIEQRPGIWTASQGFRAIEKDNDGVIYPIDKFETSVVTQGFEANLFTISEVV